MCADYCNGEVMAMNVRGEGSGLSVMAEAVTLAESQQVSAVVSGTDGAVYVLSLETVYRFDPA